MKLYELLENNAETKLENIEITSVTDNTKKVCEGSLFVCVKGGSFDGHSAAEEMLEKGAAAVITERDLGLGDRQIIVENSREFYGGLCAKWFDHPEKKLELIGVTGTNGKTTITNVIKHILTSNGHKTKGSGGDDTKENLIEVCRICHRLIHDGKINPLEKRNK